MYICAAMYNSHKQDKDMTLKANILIWVLSALYLCS